MPGNALPLQNIPYSLRQLSKPQARFCLSVARFIESELSIALTGSRILVGLSGGADSCTLLLCLHYLAGIKKFSLCAAHLDHALRPSSAAEAEWCKELCSQLSIPFFSTRLDIASMSQDAKTGIEEYARSARYAFFNSVADQERCCWIATGHNKNDLAEDVLMRLVRGAGWPGLGGMPAVAPSRRLMRPLLMSSRPDIENFLAGIGLTWLEDESNIDQAYFRNRVRSVFLPLVLKENPSFLDTVAGLWLLARTDEAYFDELLSETLATGKDIIACSSLCASEEVKFFTGLNQLKTLPKALRLRLYKYMLAKLGKGQPLLDNLLRLDAGLTSLLEGKGRQRESRHQFPGGKQAVVSSKGIRWEKS